MKTKTPDAIISGHDSLCEEIQTIIVLGGNIGEKAQSLYKVMSEHFQKEEKYAFPPLGLLLALSEGNWEFEASEAIKMSEILQARLFELNNEHESISKILQELKIIADYEDNSKAKRFIKNLTVHIDIEDQVLYPATILIGNYLKRMQQEN